MQAGYKSPCLINSIQLIHCYLKLDFRAAGVIFGRALFLKIPMLQHNGYAQSYELTAAVMGEYKSKRG